MRSSRVLLNGLFIACGLAAILPVAAAHAGERTLYEFRGHRDGAVPAGSLIMDGAGNLYGTTIGGGGSCPGGCGVVFEIGANHAETVRYAFAGGDDGSAPAAGLISDAAGNFYGTTVRGGGSVNCGDGCGTVFKLAANGSETVLYAFQGGNDGYEPLGNLVADQSGNLYGETDFGGDYSGANCDIDGCGTVFEVQPDGTKLTLHSFQSGSDGDYPVGGLVIDGVGTLYGTTGAGGGSGCGGGGCGTVFEIPASGAETILYAFQDYSDGVGPVGLVMDSSGNLYGATAGGGGCSTNDYCGTVYRLAPNGTKTQLYDFKGGADDGRTPESALIMDKAGNLFGTTFSGGPGCKNVGGCGTVFELSRSGNETVLRKLKHGEGSNPVASLLLGEHKELYGTAERGGKRNNGTVFEIKK